MIAGRSIRILARMVLVACIALPATAGTIANPFSLRDHQALARSSVFDSVGQFTGTSTSGDYSASGVYLGDGWVLTAAHVVDEATSLIFNVGGTTHEAEAWAYHADWDADNLLDGADIALVKLAAYSDITITAATCYTGSTSSLRGALTVTAGYGLTGSGFTGYLTSSGVDTKLAGTNIIDMIYGDDVLISDFDSGRRQDNATGWGMPTRYEYLIAPGDSGGGAFAYDRATGQWVLVGINSFVLGTDGMADSDFGDISGQISVSYYADWIDGLISGDPEAIASSISSDGFYGDSVITFFSIPEPASMALLGLSLFLVRRRYTSLSMPSYPMNARN